MQGLFIISSRLAYFWDGQGELFLTEDTFLTYSRRFCMEHLMKTVSKEQAIDIVTTIQKKPNIWYSF